MKIITKYPYFMLSLQMFYVRHLTFILRTIVLELVLPWQTALIIKRFFPLLPYDRAMHAMTNEHFAYSNPQKLVSRFASLLRETELNSLQIMIQYCYISWCTNLNQCFQANCTNSAPGVQNQIICDNFHISILLISTFI